MIPFPTEFLGVSYPELTLTTEFELVGNIALGLHRANPKIVGARLPFPQKSGVGILTVIVTPDATGSPHHQGNIALGHQADSLHLEIGKKVGEVHLKIWGLFDVAPTFPRRTLGQAHHLGGGQGTTGDPLQFHGTGKIIGNGNGDGQNVIHGRGDGGSIAGQHPPQKRNADATDPGKAHHTLGIDRRIGNGGGASS